MTIQHNNYSGSIAALEAIGISKEAMEKEGSMFSSILKGGARLLGRGAGKAKSALSAFGSKGAMGSGAKMSTGANPGVFVGSGAGKVPMSKALTLSKGPGPGAMPKGPLRSSVPTAQERILGWSKKNPLLAAGGLYAGNKMLNGNQGNTTIIQR